MFVFLNDDAKILIKDTNLIGKKVDVAMQDIVISSAKLGYINVNKKTNAVLVSASLIETGKENKLQKELKDMIEEKFKEDGIYENGREKRRERGEDMV